MKLFGHTHLSSLALDTVLVRAGHLKVYSRNLALGRPAIHNLAEGGRRVSDHLGGASIFTLMARRRRYLRHRLY